MAWTPKHVKEAFYQGHSGAPCSEVTCLCLCLPLLIILGELIKGWLGLLARPGQADTPGRRLAAATVEVVTVVLPHVLLYTEAIPAIPTCNTLLAILCGLAVIRLLQPLQLQPLQQQHSPTGVVVQHDQQHPQPGTEPAPAQQQLQHVNPSTAEDGLLEALSNITSQRCRYIGVYRGGVMLVTCMCILAVDFRAFPRRFAKTSVWGMGFMDLGVGGVVLAGGLVARTHQHTAAGGRIPLVRRLVRGVRAAAPCWVLWGLRLASVQALGYQEAEEEYGVHWNFFATLSLVTLATHLLAAPDALTPALAVGGCVMHQAALAAGLGAWARASTRDPTSWFSLNKEGLVSTPGYWVTAVAGKAMGYGLRHSLAAPCAQATRRLVAPDETETTTEMKPTFPGRRQLHLPRKRWQALLPVFPVLGAWLLFDACLWLVVALLHTAVEPVSRRCANATYITWLCAVSVLVLLVLLVGKLLLPGGLQPVLPQSASSNMLPLFLMANLITGAINMTVDTLQVQDNTARGILLAYAGVLCGMLAMLDAHGVVIRLK